MDAAFRGAMLNALERDPSICQCRAAGGDDHRPECLGLTVGKMRVLHTVHDQRRGKPWQFRICSWSRQPSERFSDLWLVGRCRGAGRMPNFAAANTSPRTKSVN